MNHYPPPPWPPLQPPWPPAMDRETEHRLTQLEATASHHQDHHDEHFETTDRHRDRLNTHERVLLLLAGMLSIVLQDKFPAIAAMIKGTMP